MVATKISRPEQLKYTPRAVDTTRADLIRLAGDRLASKAVGVFREATADWHPEMETISPLVPLFTLPNKLLTRLGNFFLADSTIKKVAKAIDKHELSMDELAQILRPLQDNLAEAGWCSAAFIRRPTTTYTDRGEESEGVDVNETDGYVLLAIGADPEAMAAQCKNTFAFVEATQ